MSICAEDMVGRDTHRCRLCEITSTSTPDDCSELAKKIETGNITTHLLQASACQDAPVQPTIDELLQVTFQSLTKVLKHGRAPGQDDVLGTLRRVHRAR